MYSVDVECIQPPKVNNSGFISYHTEDCNVDHPTYSSDTGKEFATIYMGYSNEAGFADWYLSTSCGANATHKFLVQWTQKDSSYKPTSPYDSPVAEIKNETALYCEPTYFSQAVNATVSVPGRSPLHVVTTGPKVPLRESLFNTTSFEWGMNSGREQFKNRGDYPIISWPSMKDQVQDMDLDLTYLGPMAGFAIAAYQRPAIDYLDPDLLKASYQAAYRLLFSRQMVDVLSSELDSSTATGGTRQYTSRAVIVVPVFAYLVEGLLGLVIIFAAFLLYISMARPRNLSSNPGNIGSMMALVAEQEELLAFLKGHDQSTDKELKNAVKKMKFGLTKPDSNSGFQLELKDSDPALENRATTDLSRSSPFTGGVRPLELRSITGLVFISMNIVMLVVFAVYFVKSKRENGLPLPSTNRFVRQLVENYIPTAIATVIEPAWVVLNRILCTLQPFEDLRRGKSSPSSSITVDYTSLPPQLTFFKALKARHWILAAVCWMALLSNLLAVAFSGLFNEEIADVAYRTTFAQPLQPIMDITALNNTDTGFETVLFNRTVTDHFYIAMSNVTAGTPLSSWTDGRMYYMPFNQTTGNNDTWMHKATTRAYGVEMSCVQLQEGGGSNSVQHTMSSNGLAADYTFNINFGDESPACRERQEIDYEGIPNSLFAAEWTARLCDSEYIVSAWQRGNATRRENYTVTEVDISNVTFHSFESTFIACRPYIKTGLAEVIVDSTGIVQNASNFQETNASVEFFQHSPSDAARYINYMMDYSRNLSDSNTFAFNWHNDSYPDDYYNYLIRETYNTTRLIDPATPVPSFSEAAEPFANIYTELVALSFSANAALLFPQATELTVEGYNIKPEIRIFMSTAMFIIAETIIGLYIIVSIMVYIRRPWRFLPRLPTTIASNIAYFAASHAVLDLQGTSAMSQVARDKHVQQMGHKYGFGSFIGTDRKAHIGIERQPFFTKLRKTTTGQMTSASDSEEEGRGGAGAGQQREEKKKPWSRLFHLKNRLARGQVVEGGMI
ncbi:hypothetical protein DBV05_g3192 [Lasiodiplodia theobromae]|uniref:Uncharacterized protein n=1 Tax=Lasiodiplodia theobromae TaxID=45133 RepID=A0A5N5DK38_9PEZI|nr:hypothetical protein DBV05_g3192 [Lasiodiplodia theobromae]